jgi:hypothetical protein
VIGGQFDGGAVDNMVDLNKYGSISEKQLTGKARLAHTYVRFQDGSIADCTANQFDSAIPECWFPADTARYLVTDMCYILPKERPGILSYWKPEVSHGDGGGMIKKKMDLDHRDAGAERSKAVKEMRDYDGMPYERGATYNPRTGERTNHVSLGGQIGSRPPQTRSDSE